MSKDFCDSSSLLAKLTISAIDKARKNSKCWSDPNIHKALIIVGLNLLVASNELMVADLNKLNNS